MINCYLSGLLGIALLGGSILTLTVSKEQHDVLRNVLSEDIDKKYEDIVNERRNHYIIGLVLGMIIATTVIKDQPLLNYYTRITLFLTITLMTAVLIYTIMPKSDYILNHLKTKEENVKWLEVYKNMKTQYFIGLILGALSSVPLSFILC